MFVPGLVSITFRKLTPEEIVNLTRRAGLESIEWGGDVHVPHGKYQVAADVNRMTRDAGLQVACYGSYYRLGRDPNDAKYLPFSKVLDTAAALQAPSIRVWAGTQSSEKADDAYFARCAEDARQCAEYAAMEDIRIVLEYHEQTLTDDPAAAVRLLQEINHPNVQSLWQPPNFRDYDHCLHTLREIKPYLNNLHVFHWTGPENERRPLAEGAERWERYLSAAHNPVITRHALLEFVADDDPEQLVRDAQTLKALLAGAQDKTAGVP
jgi:sugar phosphate isomerase/epimerase